MSEESDVAAAEYVLGTLDAAERSAFAARLLHDADARRAVAEWERRFAGLEEMLQPVQPSPDAWARLEALVMPPTSRATPFRVVEGGFPAGSTLKVSRDRWRAAAVAFGSLAAALVLVVLQRAIVPPSHESDAGSYLAAVNRGGDKPALLIRVDLKTRQVFVRPVAAETPTGHSLELWYIGDDKAPRSMGLVDKAPSTLTIPQTSNATSASFAVSVEPLGGSKTSGPTGPVVYAGQLIKD